MVPTAGALLNGEALMNVAENNLLLSCDLVSVTCLLLVIFHGVTDVPYDVN